VSVPPATLTGPVKPVLAPERTSWPGPFVARLPVLVIWPPTVVVPAPEKVSDVPNESLSLIFKVPPLAIAAAAFVKDKVRLPEPLPIFTAALGGALLMMAAAPPTVNVWPVVEDERLTDFLSNVW
jgi:hypothetical protein